MNKYALCVLNLNNFMTSNSKNSFLKFCNKFDIDYLEYDKFHHKYPYYSKFFIINSCINFDFVIYLDADMIIMDDVPNIFDQLSHDKFNVVKDNCKNLDWLIKTYKDEPYIVSNDLLNNKLRYEIYSENFFNSGFWGFKPELFIDNFINLQNILNDITDEYDYYSGWGKLEQSLINYELISSGKIKHVSYKFNDYNYLQDSYIYHFTGDFLSKDKINNFSNKRCEIHRLSL